MPAQASGAATGRFHDAAASAADEDAAALGQLPSDLFGGSEDVRRSFVASYDRYHHPASIISVGQSGDKTGEQ
jgi:hypothetical protein